MDELAEIKAMIETFRETLTFLVEQEKIGGAIKNTECLEQASAEVSTS